MLNRHELDDLYALTIETAVASGVCVITGTHADRIIPDQTSAGSAPICRRTTSRSSPTCRAHRSGDSMTAGLAVAALRGLPPVEMLQLAAADGRSRRSAIGWRSG